MWKRAITAAAVGMSLLAGACASYVPPEGVPTAKIIAVNGPGAANGGVALSYATPDYSRTDTLKGHDIYSYDIEALIPAETQAHIEVTGYVMGYYNPLYCDSYFTFLPRAGRTYVVKNEMINRECRSWVEDSEGGLVEGFRPEEGPVPRR